MNPNELQKPKSHRDTVSTVTNTGKRNWVYALKPKRLLHQSAQLFCLDLLSDIFL